MNKVVDVVGSKDDEWNSQRLLRPGMDWHATASCIINKAQ
jgi:hypothetical protein